MVKHITILTAVFILSGCGTNMKSGPNGGNSTEGSRTSPPTPGAGLSAAPDQSLAGVWKTNCILNPISSIFPMLPINYMKAEIRFYSDRTYGFSTFFSDSNCTQPTHANYGYSSTTYGGSSSIVAGAYNIDMPTLISMSEAYLSQSTVQSANDETICNRANWQLGVYQDVISCRGDAETRLSIYRVHGNQLLMGKLNSTYFLTRPTELDASIVYYRQ